MIQVGWGLLNFLPQLNRERFRTMLCNLFSSMTVKDCKQSCACITTDFVHMSMRVLHIRSELSVLILCICIFFHAIGWIDVEADILSKC